MSGHIHLTPQEIATEHEMTEDEVVELCLAHAIPIYQGRIDKTLFKAAIEKG
jgi:hypothetical protein